jgi:hypothetical protein
MSYPNCDHLKEDGVFCSSPALHNQRYCCFHLNARALECRSLGEQFDLPDDTDLEAPPITELADNPASIMQTGGRVA